MPRSAFTVNQPNSTALRALNYSPVVESLRRAGGKTLHELGARVTDSFGDIFTARPTAPGHGVQVLAQADTFAAEPTGKWIRPDSFSDPEKHILKRWQIAIAGAGQMSEGNLFGRSILIDRRFAGLFVASDSVVLEFEEPGSDDNLWTYAFLNSRPGLAAMHACAYGTSIPRLRLDLLGEVRVPQAPPADRAKVAALVREAVKQRERHVASFTAARRIIEDLPDMQDAYVMCAERRARYTVRNAPFKSLMGWTFASAGRAQELLESRWRLRVRDVVAADGLFFGLLRKRTPCASGVGIPLISQRDLHQVRQFPLWIRRPDVAHYAVFSPPHSIAMAGVGGTGEGDSLAKPAFVTRRLATFALTQHILRIVPLREHSPVLHAYFSTQVGRRLLRTAAAGTIVQQLRTDIIEDLPVPELPESRAARVRELHADAYSALDAGVDAETEAIRIIEEEVLPKWLA